MTSLLGITLFVLALMLAIFLHEGGHFATAKFFGMKVERFFLGFGPTVWSFRRGETEYGIKALPLGGFCKIAGMSPYENDGNFLEEDRSANDGATPAQATADWGYFRLRAVEYSAEDLARWAGTIRDLFGAHGAFVYFKHEDGATGPPLARKLTELLSSA